jgi:hypothetical protein
MNCDEATRIMLESDLGSLDERVRLELGRHCADCEKCRALSGMLAGMQSSTLPAGLTEKTRRIVSEPSAASGPAPSAWRFALLTAACLLLVAGPATAVLGLKGWLALSSAQAWGCMLVLSLSGAAGFVALDGELRPGSARRLTGAGAAGVLGLAYLGVLSLVAVSNESGHRWGAALFCFTAGSLVSAAMYWALRYAGRWGYPLHATGAGLAMGALSALTGLLVLQLFCPKLELEHLLLGHATPLLAGITFAWWFERRRHAPPASKP